MSQIVNIYLKNYLCNILKPQYVDVHVDGSHNLTVTTEARLTREGALSSLPQHLHLAWHIIFVVNLHNIQPHGLVKSMRLLLQIELLSSLPQQLHLAWHIIFVVNLHNIQPHGLVKSMRLLLQIELLSSLPQQLHLAWHIIFVVKLHNIQPHGPVKSMRLLLQIELEYRPNA
ncbi:hypothetical protein J6590_054655 [Homalodisca vitripennis]|nr:hypothetical protein J6590_054655 [Homalodisca vitripennis]